MKQKREYLRPESEQIQICVEKNFVGTGDPIVNPPIYGGDDE